MPTQFCNLGRSWKDLDVAQAQLEEWVSLGSVVLLRV